MTFRLLLCSIAVTSLSSLPSLGSTPIDVEPDARSSLLAIGALEDARVFEEDGLGRLLAHSSPVVRRRAVLACGRIGDPRSRASVTALLADADPGIVAEAAFALGLLGDGAAVADLSQTAREGDPAVREQALLALGRLGGDEAFATAIEALATDRPPEVRRAAALALARATSKPAREALLVALGDEDAELRWRAALALGRSGFTSGSDRIVALKGDGHPLVRVFGTRLLRGGGDATLGALLELARDDSEQVVVEAVRGLAAVGTPGATRGLLVLSRDERPHVRMEATQGLASIDLDALQFPRDERILAKAAVILSLRDESLQVRAAGIEAYGKVFGVHALRRLPGLLQDEQPLLRASAYRALAHVEKPDIFGLLQAGLKSGGARVGEAVVEAARTINLPPARSLLISALTSSDLAVLTSAADVLGARKEASALEPLLSSLARATGTELAEARAAMVRALGALGGDQANEAIRAALGDPDAMVRLEARRTLVLGGVEDGELPPAWKLERVVPAPETPGVEVEKSPSRPLVRIVTRRGAIDLELFPAEAPLHVAGFLKRVERGFYDGLAFHRVVPNWVVQGGDPRGDGWGGGGIILRDQVTRRPYERGSVGIPTSGKDTGGCQIFITLVPAPRLVGAYTQIGRVVKGMEVVSRIEKEDRMTSVRRVR